MLFPPAREFLARPPPQRRTARWSVREAFQHPRATSQERLPLSLNSREILPGALPRLESRRPSSPPISLLIHLRRRRIRLWRKSTTSDAGPPLEAESARTPS